MSWMLLVLVGATAAILGWLMWRANPHPPHSLEQHSTTKSPPDFDPSVLKRFEKEIATWPKEQAVAALLAVKAILAGRPAEFEEHYPNLTVSQFRVVTDVLDEIYGRPSMPHDD